MAMQHVRRDHHHGAGADAFAGDLVRLDRGAADRSKRRIKTQRLLDHGSGLDQPVGQIIGRPAELASGLGAHALPPLLRLREQVERPGDGIGGGFVACGHEGDDVGADLRFADAAAGLRILGFQQQRQNIPRDRSWVRRKPAPREPQ